MKKKILAMLLPVALAAMCGSNAAAQQAPAQAAVSAPD